MEKVKIREDNKKIYTFMYILLTIYISISYALSNLRLKDIIFEECKYILVDEFQDTNKIQFELLTKLSQKYGNLFCVGDEDQCATRS